MTVSFPDLDMLIEEVEVRRVDRLSPSFVRFELGSPALAELGNDGPYLDQRIKLVFPHRDGPVPSFEGADDSWWETWVQRPVEERGHMRTYTVRDVVGSGTDTRLVVDIVLHDDDARRRRGRPGQHVGGAGEGRRPAGDHGAAPRLRVRRHRVRAGCGRPDLARGRRDRAAGDRRHPARPAT